jgi:hypothetical protein
MLVKMKKPPGQMTTAAKDTGTRLTILTEA